MYVKCLHTPEVFICHHKINVCVSNGILLLLLLLFSFCACVPAQLTVLFTWSNLFSRIKQKGLKKINESLDSRQLQRNWRPF